jgi:hypothetical protein
MATKSISIVFIKVFDVPKLRFIRCYLSKARMLNDLHQLILCDLARVSGRRLFTVFLDLGFLARRFSAGDNSGLLDFLTKML